MVQAADKGREMITRCRRRLNQSSWLSLAANLDRLKVVFLLDVQEFSFFFISMLNHFYAFFWTGENLFSFIFFRFFDFKTIPVPRMTFWGFDEYIRFLLSHNKKNFLSQKQVMTRRILYSWIQLVYPCSLLKSIYKKKKFFFIHEYNYCIHVSH